MATKFDWAAWRFRPSLWLTAAAAAVIAVTVAAGNWQTRRAEEKLQLSKRLDASAQAPVLTVPASTVDPADFQYRRVRARGEFVPQSMLLLDNKVHAGVAGYHVLTPLKIAGSGMHVLVNRGWIAGGDRQTLPQVATPAGMQTLEGLAVVPSGRFLQLGPESAAGPVRQNLVLQEEGPRLSLSLQPFVIQQTSASADGLVRQWERPDTGVDKHRAYALQWYSFAFLGIIFYVFLSFRRTEPR